MFSLYKVINYSTNISVKQFEKSKKYEDKIESYDLCTNQHKNLPWNYVSGNFVICFPITHKKIQTVRFLKCYFNIYIYI